MEIEISNCNNIDHAKVNIERGKLNIKFAPNGTGKSTISRAITFSAQNNIEALKSLVPFKLQKSNPDGLSPTVSGTNDINKVMCFDENYVSKFTFQQDELVSNSFNIFIKTETYVKIEDEIDEMVRAVRSTFVGNESLELFIRHLNSLSGAFKLTNKGVSKTSVGVKAFAKGNIVKNIPKGLESYTPFITSGNNVEWVDWQTKGYEKFLDISEACCPFCSGDYRENKEKIQKVSAEYDKNVIKNLVGIISVLDELGDYFSEQTVELTREITTLEGGLERAHEEHIASIKKQTDILLEKIDALRNLNGFSFNKDENVKEKLEGYKINLNYLPHLQSEKTKEIVGGINKSLDELILQAGRLKGKINIQHDAIERLIGKHKENINAFLSYAGYRYQVDISGSGMDCKLKLRHLDFDNYLSRGDQYLSYGERNAFALVLFMYECLSTRPDLIILDDPISSFDKNKKFAILEMLFKKKDGHCLKNMTVLMLTHDVEPIIDTIKSVRKSFNGLVSASHLRNDGGNISESKISSIDISTFAKICKEIIASDCDEIIKLIYLRRHCEIIDDTGDAYEVLSNLFHCRDIPLDSRKEKVGEGSELDIMSDIDFNEGCRKISAEIEGFDYSRTISIVSDKNKIKELYRQSSSGYEKLQLFRIIESESKNSIVRKFVNETYHIENEFICQLDPRKFDLIPEYIIKECSLLIEAE